TPNTNIYTLSLHDALPIFEHWPKGAVVLYAYDASVTEYKWGNPRGQIESAIQQWNVANVHNGSYVQFREADASVAHLFFRFANRSEEHTSELQSPCNLVCR